MKFNLSFRWWPEIPTVLAIFYATVIMGDVVHYVHQQEKASSQYTGGSNKLSKMVSGQALWFVGAFYVTWVPYLVLQVRQAATAEVCYYVELAYQQYSSHL
jgi:hypothetical protein